MTLDFARSPAFTVGIEDELLLVDPDTLALAHASEAVASRMDAPPGLVQLEWYAAEIELTSPRCAAVPEAVAEVERLRALLRSTGARAFGSGTHPDGRLGDVRPVPRRRFKEDAVASVGRMVYRTPEAALHVHIGMPDAETAVRAANGLRERIPLIHALAANSPFAFGRDSGYASARAILNRSYPRVDIPPAPADYESYAAAVERLTAAADIDDYTLVWWEVRLHPRLGTVEVRCMDSQARLGSVAGLAALVHGLALREAEGGTRREWTAHEVLDESAYRASRFGMDAALWDGSSLRAARELAREALAEALPYARELGSDAALEEVERIVREGVGADRQRDVHARLGMRGLLEGLCEETEQPMTGTGR